MLAELRKISGEAVGLTTEIKNGRLLNTKPENLLREQIFSS
jgi:hypothetical protein